jgi:hypothetical protein
MGCPFSLKGGLPARQWPLSLLRRLLDLYPDASQRVGELPLCDGNEETLEHFINGRVGFALFNRSHIHSPFVDARLRANAIDAIKSGLFFTS